MTTPRAASLWLPTYGGSLVALAWLVGPELRGASRPLALFELAGAAMLMFLAIAADALLSLAARRAAADGPAVLPRRLAIALLLGVPALLGALQLGASPALALLLVPAAIGALLVDRLARRLPGDARFWWSAAGAALELAAAFVLLHRAQLTFVAMQPGTEKLHFELFIATWLATVALWLPWAQRLEARRGQPPRSRRSYLWTGVALLAGLLLIEVNRRVLIGLYPAVHKWLAVVGTLSLDAALAPWLSRGAAWPRARAAAGGLALAAITAGALTFQYAPLHTDDPVFRAAAMQRTLAAPLLDLFPAPSFAAGTATDHPLLAYPQYLDVAWAGRRDLDILFISVDTVRIDALPAPGAADASRAPNFAALAATCADFRGAYAPASRTSVAMGALLIGRYSANIQWEVWLRTRADDQIHDPKALTPAQIKALGDVVHTIIAVVPPTGNLPSRMAAAGLRTFAMPFAGKSEFFSRFDAGFDEYADLTRRGWQAPTSTLLAEAALEQRARLAGRRSFQWVHFFDPHEAHGSSERYAQLIGDFDAGLGKLLAGVDRDKTAIVVLADHGEAFGEHGTHSHGTSVFQEQVRVPLLVCVPGLAPRVFTEPVSTLDGIATMLVLAGADTREIDGVNLLPIIAGERPFPPHRPIFIEQHGYQSADGHRTQDLKAVVLDGWKYILDRINYTRGLYHVADDPRETRNLSGQVEAIETELDDVLNAFANRGQQKFPMP